LANLDAHASKFKCHKAHLLHNFSTAEPIADVKLFPVKEPTHITPSVHVPHCFRNVAQFSPQFIPPIWAIFKLHSKLIPATIFLLHNARTRYTNPGAIASTTEKQPSRSVGLQVSPAE
jgi:hypothetical protein